MTRQSVTLESLKRTKKDNKMIDRFIDKHANVIFLVLALSIPVSTIIRAIWVFGF